MAEVLVVADDLTGANATAAGFARAGLRAATTGAARRPDVVAEMVRRFDVLVASTEGRHLSPAEAGDRLAAVVRAGWPARLVCNRIDTTLRGNVGATTARLLTEVADLCGTRVVVFCAPAHPGADRHTVDGTQLLGGRRLEDTEVARDPRTPVHTSDVREILAQQAKLRTANVGLSAVTGPPDRLVDTIAELLRTPVEVLIVDALTEDHLDRAASAAARAANGSDAPITWVTSDPGPGSVAMAKALGIRGQGEAAPLLAVSGSATELTRRQLRQLVADRPVTLLRAPTPPGSPVPDIEATSRKLDEALDAARADEIVLLATVVDDSDLRTVSPDEAQDISVHLARAVRHAIEHHPVDGLFTTGGDVTDAVLSELGSHGLEISGEVIPLAVAGSVVGGPWDGLQVVTKGGLIGDSTTTVACLDHLRHNADIHRRQVVAAESRITALPQHEPAAHQSTPVEPTRK